MMRYAVAQRSGSWSWTHCMNSLMCSTVSQRSGIAPIQVSRPDSLLARFAGLLECGAGAQLRCDRAQVISAAARALFPRLVGRCIGLLRLRARSVRDAIGLVDSVLRLPRRACGISPRFSRGPPLFAGLVTASPVLVVTFTSAAGVFPGFVGASAAGRLRSAGFAGASPSDRCRIPRLVPNGVRFVGRFDGLPDVLCRISRGLCRISRRLSGITRCPLPD